MDTTFFLLMCLLVFFGVGFMMFMVSTLKLKNKISLPPAWLEAGYFDKDEAGEKHSLAFRLSSCTVYTEDSILDFMHVSGLGIAETEKVLMFYDRIGINNLYDIIILLKCNHLNYDEFRKNK